MKTLKTPFLPLILMVVIMFSSCNKNEKKQLNRTKEQPELRASDGSCVEGVGVWNSEGNFSELLIDPNSLVEAFKEEWEEEDVEVNVDRVVIVSEGPGSEHHYLVGVGSVESNQNSIIEGIKLALDDENYYQIVGASGFGYTGGGGGEIHKCEGNDCTSCSFDKSGGEITGCDCNDFTGFCNHTIIGGGLAIDNHEATKAVASVHCGYAETAE